MSKKNNNLNNDKNIAKDSKGSNDYYKQIFANPMRTYSDKQTKAIESHFNKLRKQKGKK